MAFNGGARWLHEHIMAQRDLMVKHGTGFVLWAVTLAYDAPLTFFDADELSVAVQGRARGRGTQFESTVVIRGEKRVAAEVTACSIPLALGDDPSLSGQPAALKDDLLALFQEDERERRPFRSQVPSLRSRTEAEGHLLARGETALVVGRSRCEVADQWFWGALPAMVSDAREALYRDHPETLKLTPLMASPLRNVDLLFANPLRLFDHATIVSSAYAVGPRVTVVHEVLSSEPARGLLQATAIERF